MTDPLRFTVSALLFLLLLLATYTPAQTQSNINHKTKSSASQNLTTQAGGSSPVTGSGTPDRLVKWTGSSSTSYTIGDSIITEDKFGKVGIGTPAPTSKLTVQGMIETTLGGYKFPDGTIQTTAAGTLSIFHDQTLKGGNGGSPLGVAVPLSLFGTTEFNVPIIDAINVGEGSGVIGRSAENFGLLGLTNGVAGFSVSGGVGVAGVAQEGIGVFGKSVGGDGVFGTSTTGRAGHFVGNVEISGNLSKGGGSFKIDHPLDPANKYLYHSFVESPDMMNIYNGNATTDENGDAVIAMPDYFEALNREFRYQLTVIGTFAQAMVASEIKDNRFAIKTNAPGVKVSWQVTGVRQDAWANKNRIPVEVEKEKKERGYYLHPEAHDQAEEKSIEWAHNPKMMQQWKEIKEQQKANNR